MTERHPDGGIAGWMLSDQLAWLHERAKTRFRIVEVGAYKGRTTQALASATRGKVWVVDRWRSDNPVDMATESYKAQGADHIFDEFLENLRPWASKLVIMRMDSGEAVRRLGHLTFDMIFIDGDHRYESVREDIRLWNSLLARGGLLCGHDGEIEPVARAVRELVPEAKFADFKQLPPFDFRPSRIWWAVR